MTHFWIPRIKIIEPKDAIQLHGIGIAGMVRAIRIGPDGKERWRGPWGKNLWTDAGLNYSFNLGSSFNPYGEVGTGNAEPTPGDSALQVRVAQQATTSLQANTLVDPGGGLLFYGADTRRYTFNPVGVSHNLAEFGFRCSSSTGTLGVRALFRDVGGVPTTVTWVAGETLLVDHQIRYYGSPADLTGQLTMGTSNQVHDLLLRATGVAGTSGYVNSTYNFLYSPITTSNSHTTYTNVTNLGAYNQGITATSLTSTGTDTLLPYTNNSFFREKQVIWGPTQSNAVNGIQAIVVGANPGNHKIQFSPAIMKTNLDTLTLVLSSPTWSRYTP